MTSLSTLFISLAALFVIAAAVHHHHDHGHHHPHNHSNCKICDALSKAILAQYSYDRIGQFAISLRNTLSKTSQDFFKLHNFEMLKSPTANAIEEMYGKITYLKEFAGEQCLNDGEDKLKVFRKKHAEVVFACEASWLTNPEVSEKSKALLKQLDDLDAQAKAVIGAGCKKGDACYTTFRASTVGKEIDLKLSTLNENDFVELQVLSDISQSQSVMKLFQCHADNTDSLRKEIYEDIAVMNVCAANIGLLPEF